MSYTASLSSGAALPAWVHFNTATQIFTGTPVGTDRGIITIKVTANDGMGGSVFKTFTITVPNTPPTTNGIIPD